MVVLLSEVQGERLTPACRAAVRAIADAVAVAPSDTEDAPVWVSLDLRTLLDDKVAKASGDAIAGAIDLLNRLLTVRLIGLDERSGERRASALLAEWRLGSGEGGRKRAGVPCRLLIAPYAAAALRGSNGRRRIDVEIARGLTGHAGALFGLLQDRRSARQWSPSLDELKARLGVAGRYANAKDFRVRVLEPAMTAINATGALTLSVELERRGRAVRVVHFRWENPDGARTAGGEVAATLAGEPPLVVMDRLARWLGEQPLAVRRAWWRRARELGAPNRPKATDVEHVGSWTGWVVEEMRRALAQGGDRPEEPTGRPNASLLDVAAQ